MIDLNKKHGRLGPYLAKHPGLFGLYTKVSTTTSGKGLIDHGTLKSYETGELDEARGPHETCELLEGYERHEDDQPYGGYKPRESVSDFDPRRVRPFETPHRSTTTVTEISSAESLRFETPSCSVRGIVVSGRSSVVSHSFQSPSPNGLGYDTPITGSRLRFSSSEESSSSSDRENIEFTAFDKLLDRIEEMLSQCIQHSFVMSYSGPIPLPHCLAKSLTGLRTYQDMVVSNILVLLTKPQDSVFIEKIKSDQTWLSSPDPEEDQNSQLWAAHFTALRFLRLQIENTHFGLTLGLIGLVTAHATVKHLSDLLSRALSPTKPRASVYSRTPSRHVRSSSSSIPSGFSVTVPRKARALLGLNVAAGGTPCAGPSPGPCVPTLCFEPATPPDNSMDVGSPISRQPTSKRLRRMPKFSTPCAQEDPFVTPSMSSLDESPSPGTVNSSSPGTVNFKAPPPSAVQVPPSSPTPAPSSTAHEEPEQEVTSPVVPPWGAQAALGSPRNELALRKRQKRLAALERELGKMAEEMANMADVELVTIQKVLKGKGFLPA